MRANNGSLAMRSRTRAATPATCGLACEVPVIRTYWSRYPAETTLPPGAVISGLSVMSGDTPQEEVG